MGFPPRPPYGPKLHRSSARSASAPELKCPSAVIQTPTQAWAWVESLCQRSSISQPKGWEIGSEGPPTCTFWVTTGKALLLSTSFGFSSSSKVTSCISPSGAQLGAWPHALVPTAVRRVFPPTIRSGPPGEGAPVTERGGKKLGGGGPVFRPAKAPEPPE